MPHDHHTQFSVEGPVGAQTLLLLDNPWAGAVTWSAVAGPLAEQFRLIRPIRDRLFPNGTVPDIAQLGEAGLEALRAAGGGRTHILGAGLGGAVALWLAIHHPEHVGRIAVIGTLAQAHETAFWEGLATQFRGGWKAEASSKLINGLLTSGLRARDVELAQHLEEAIAKNSDADLAALSVILAKFDLAPDLARVAAPTLVVVGEEDPFVPSDAVDKLLAGLSNAKLHRIEHAANLPTLEQPGQVVNLLLNHFGSSATLETGFISRRVALGDTHVDKTIASITPFTKPFQEFLTRYCWGEVWTRPGLSRRDRSLATLSVIVALGAEHEIPVHVRAGLRHGLKIEEFPEIFQQLALYTGLPRAFGALNITQRTLIEDGLLPTKTSKE